VSPGSLRLPGVTALVSASAEIAAVTDNNQRIGPGVPNYVQNLRRKPNESRVGRAGHEGI
jgi:hypothetical protein